MLRCTSIPYKYTHYDDWYDNKLTKRGHYRTPAGGMMGRTGFTPFLKRPEWTIEYSDPAVSGGVLTLDGASGAATNDGVSTPSTFTEGTWEWDAKASNTSGTRYLKNNFIYEDADNNLRVNFRPGGTPGNEVDLIKTDAGVASTLITGSWTADTNWHTIKATRDTSGNFELFFDGVSQGTATDTFLPSISKILFFVDLSGITAVDYDIDNLKVY